MKYIANIIRILFLALFLLLLANGKVMLWLVLFAISLVAALIFGRVYCGYVCPMNTLMIPTEWLSKKLNLQTSATPKWLKRVFRMDIFRYQRSNHASVEKTPSYRITHSAILAGYFSACYTKIQTCRVPQPSLPLWCCAKNIWPIRKAVRKS